MNEFDLNNDNLNNDNLNGTDFLNDISLLIDIANEIDDSLLNDNSINNSLNNNSVDDNLTDDNLIDDKKETVIKKRYHINLINQSLYDKVIFKNDKFYTKYVDAYRIVNANVSKKISDLKFNKLIDNAFNNEDTMYIKLMRACEQNNELYVRYLLNCYKFKNEHLLQVICYTIKNNKKNLYLLLQEKVDEYTTETIIDMLTSISHNYKIDTDGPIILKNDYNYENEIFFIKHIVDNFVIKNIENVENLISVDIFKLLSGYISELKKGHINYNICSGSKKVDNVKIDAIKRGLLDYIRA